LKSEVGDHVSPASDFFIKYFSLKIGISLSGGGARGVAHIGALKALLEAGIEPEVISGASAGSVVGALYAAGYTPDEMLEFVDESKFYKLVTFGLPLKGLTKLTYLQARLEEVININDFSALKKPLFVAITNLLNGELEIRSSGELIDVIVASCSIPLVFQPVEIDNSLYVDGGLMSNMPVEALLPEVDFIIGINLMPRDLVGKKEVSNMVGIAQRCFDLSIISNTELNAEQCNWLIEPEGIGEKGVFQFTHYKKSCERGYEYLKNQIDGVTTARGR